MYRTDGLPMEAMLGESHFCGIIERRAGDKWGRKERLGLPYEDKEV